MTAVDTGTSRVCDLNVVETRDISTSNGETDGAAICGLDAKFSGNNGRDLLRCVGGLEVSVQLEPHNRGLFTAGGLESSHVVREGLVVTWTFSRETSESVHSALRHHGNM